MFGDKKNKLRDSERSLISETVSIEGTINSSGAIDIAGLVKGPVYSKEIIVRETGSITGSIEADRVEIHGHMDGKVTGADVVMRLNVKTERVVVGFSGAGRPRELEIRTTVIVEINDKEEKPLQPMDELKIFRAVTFNDTDVLATQAHEEFHIKDINKQLAIRVIQKLQDVELR